MLITSQHLWIIFTCLCRRKRARGYFACSSYREAFSDICTFLKFLHQIVTLQNLRPGYNVTVEAELLMAKMKVKSNVILIFFIVAPCILITLKFLSPTNAPLCYTYKMLKYTVKIYHDCSYMFRSIWTINREPMLNLAKVTILCRYSVKIRR
jgi:hypothetical protein